MYLKQGKWGRKPKRVQLMGSWRGPESGHEPRAPSGGQVWSRGMAGRGAGRGRGWPRAGPRALARPARCLSATHSRGLGPRKVRAPIPAPGTSAGTGRSRAACEAGAERAEPVAEARESAAAASNPALSSLRLRHARSAEGSRALRAAVALRAGARGAGDAQGRRGQSLGARWGLGRLREEGSLRPSRLLRGAQVTLT